MDDQELLNRLIGIVEDLYCQCEGFTDHPEDSQRWYNRGYADGMIKALVALGHGARIIDLRRRMDAAAATVQHQELLPWGQAYRHGEELGYKETQQTLQPTG